MLENESLWQTAEQCHAILAEAQIPHAVLGGIAVCLHGYQRNTVDVDLLVRRQDSFAVRENLQREGFAWDEEDKEFSSPSGVAVQFLVAGDRAGSGSEVRLPDPSDASVITEIEGLPVLRLSKLIESKIACGEGSLRRTHKDFADVVELILQNRLDGSFARYLHKSLRATYRQLVRASRGKP
jgi:hypothetical protein